ncbi:MAG: magnetosome biogenesis CDF transporter MamB [Rhodospirillaceae bacterium]
MRKKVLCRDCRDAAAWTDLLTALALAVFKNLLGALTGSMALQAHALHSFADFLTKSINLASIRLSSQPPTRLFPYGFGKVQFLSANFIGVSLIAGSLAFLWHNITHVSNGDLVPPLPIALVGAIVSALTAELMHRYLSCVGRRNNSPAILAAAADNRGDALSSLAVLAGISLSLLGWLVADHLAAILVSFLVLRVGVRVAWSSINGLMDGSVPDEVLERARLIAVAHDGVLGVDDLRGRRMGETWSLDLRLKIDSVCTAAQAHVLAESLKQSIVQQLHHASDVHIAFVPVVVTAEPV